MIHLFKKGERNDEINNGERARQAGVMRVRESWMDYVPVFNQRESLCIHPIYRGYRQYGPGPGRHLDMHDG